MADALASGASVRKDVGVQVPPRPLTSPGLLPEGAGAVNCAIALRPHLGVTCLGLQQGPNVVSSVKTEL